MARGDANKKEHAVPKKGDRYYTPYKEEMCEQLVKHMGQGHSFESFGGVVNVSRKTLYFWVEKHKEFAEAKEVGYAKWLQFIERIFISRTTGIEMLKGVNPKNIDIAGAIFMLKTRGHQVYYEKREIELDANEKIQVIVK